MTANQRRPGFRLPWAPDSDDTTTREGESAAAAEASSPAAATEGSADASATADAAPATTEPAEAAVEAEAVAPEVTADAAIDKVETAPGEAAPADAAAAEPARPPAAPESNEFMRDLVAAMRGVADEARENGMADLRARADEQVRKLEADAEKRREELRSRAETDVAGVDEWAKAEAERIKAEAEQRVVARRAQLDQQLAGDQARTEAETKALRDRVAAYERELEAYHAQLAEIRDPAAFAAAAKRMPQPPALSGGAAPAAAPAGAPPSPADATAATSAAPAQTETKGEVEAPVEPGTGASNGVAAPTPEIHPAEEEVLAARLAELDAKLPDEAAAAAAAPTGEPVTTEVIVKGLGSFGAITGFRQALAAVDGIDGVALSLGQTGEFVFRATHAAGFDLRSAITTLEGDGAKVEDRPEGGLRVTLDRAR
jgi:hypothetical protein